MTWHIDAETMSAYVEDRLDYARTASVEAHVTLCATCQASAHHTSMSRLRLIAMHQNTWARLADKVDRPRLSLPERALMRCGAREHTARLVASSELKTRWWLAGALILAAATGLGLFGTEVAGVAAFLLLAPVLPVAGVALAYGAGGEPAFEVAVVAPYSSFRRILVRSGVVLAAWLPVAALLSVLLPPVQTAIWLLPALALTAVTLAASSFTDPIIAAAGVGVVWLAINGAALRPLRRGDLQLLIDALPQAQIAGQTFMVAACCLALAVVITRRERFERISPA